jgi:hypothetical protein
MEQCRAANREAHGRLALAHFAKLLTTREHLALCSVPTLKWSATWSASSARLVSINRRDTDLGIVESITVRAAQGEFKCVPRVIVEEKGPYGDVPIWCEEGPAPRWMIDLTELADLPDYT